MYKLFNFLQFYLRFLVLFPILFGNFRPGHGNKAKVKTSKKRSKNKTIFLKKKAKLNEELANSLVDPARLLALNKI